MSECMLSPRGGGSGSAKVKRGRIQNENISGSGTQTATIKVTGVGFRPDVVVVYRMELKGWLIAAVIDSIAGYTKWYHINKTYDYTEERFKSYSLDDDGFTMSFAASGRTLDAGDGDYDYNRTYYIAMKE